MKDREIACVFYEYEGSCLKGKAGTFRKACQTCGKYKPKLGSSPARQNLKKQKMERIRSKDMKQQMKDY